MYISMLLNRWYLKTNQELSLTVRTKLIPEIKNIIPRAAYTITTLMSWLLPDKVANKTAAYISPPIPSTVSKDPKILLIFIVFD
jgi:hypothetical protein